MKQAVPEDLGAPRPCATSKVEWVNCPRGVIKKGALGLNLHMHDSRRGDQVRRSPPAASANGGGKRQFTATSGQTDHFGEAVGWIGGLLVKTSGLSPQEAPPPAVPSTWCIRYPPERPRRPTVSTASKWCNRGASPLPAGPSGSGWVAMEPAKGPPGSTARPLAWFSRWALGTPWPGPPKRP